MSLLATDKQRVIVGLGLTGLSCARYLTRRGQPCTVVDSRDAPPMLAALEQSCPDVRCVTGRLDADVLASADELIVSPGVALDTPAVRDALDRGARLVSELDFFMEAVDAPVVAITGSNGKSTVTAWVSDMARRAGQRVGMGGNIGVPVLDLLAEEAHDLYVLELSSFQLERTSAFRATVATVLNVVPDHLDRYPDLQAYHQAKHRIYRGCEWAVFNRDDPLTTPLQTAGMRLTSFGLGRPAAGEWGVRTDIGQTCLAFGGRALLPVSELSLPERHNRLNALASLALGDSVGLPLEAMLEALRDFAGLPHRCQTIRMLDGVRYINDSKGTNVGATVAAITGACEEDGGRVLLIAGGQAKGQDFAPLAEVLTVHGRLAIVLGEAAGSLSDVLRTAVPVRTAASLDEAVRLAHREARRGDAVLLSPACASFDMFEGYAQRGRCFEAAVQALPMEEGAA